MRIQSHRAGGYRRLILAALLALAALAWVQPAAPAGTGPDDGPTGVPEVDHVLAEWRAGDLNALLARVRYQWLPCITEPVGIPSPPFCEAGQAAGTPSPVLQDSTCHGGYSPPAIVARALAGLVRGDDDGGGGPRTVAGVIWMSPALFGYALDADDPRGQAHYALVVTEPGDESLARGNEWVYRGIFIQDGAIVALGAFGACGASLPSPDAPAWLLPPPRP